MKINQKDLIQSFPSVSINNSIFQISYGGISAKFDRKKKYVELYQFPNKYIFNSFLRMLFSILLIDKDGFLLHSCAVKKNGKCYLFFGPTASGKSTIAKQFKSSDVFSDDVIVIKFKDGKPFCFSTPFISEVSDTKNFSMKIKSLYYLNKSDKDIILKLDKKSALKKILSCVVFFTTDSFLNKKLFSIIYKLVEKVELFDLYFKKDLTFWKLLEDEFNKDLVIRER